MTWRDLAGIPVVVPREQVDITLAAGWCALLKDG
jgi:hypothetical protein